MDIINERRSIRKYTDKKVEKDIIEQLLRAAMQAPSAGNQRPWEFIVVQNKEMLTKLSNTHPYSSMVKDAPLAIVLVANENRMRFPENWQQDMSAATENLLLEVTEVGLGAVWLGIAPVEDRMKYIRELFRLEDNMLPFALVPIGYPNGQDNHFVDRFEEERIHYFE